MSNKTLSHRMNSQIKKHAKRLAFRIDLSLEQDFVQDMYILWLESTIIDNEALLWTSIKRDMSDIIFRSRKYRYTVSKLCFYSYEWLMIKETFQSPPETLRDYIFNLKLNQMLDPYLLYGNSINDTILVHQLLEHLSDQEQEYIILYYFEGYNDREIGELFEGLTRSCICKRRNKALEKMRGMLGDKL